MAITKLKALGVTDGTLTNTQINASAAIAASKLGTMTTANMPAGSVIQTVSVNITSDAYTSATSATALSAFDLTITPSAASSKILYNVTGGHQSYASASEHLKIWFYTSINGGSFSNANPAGGASTWQYSHMGGDAWGHPMAHSILLSPNTTGAVIFRPYYSTHDGSGNVFFSSNPNVWTATALEIKG